MVKFAAGGKQRGKKDLAMLAMETYGQDVYVASVCLEANYAQVMKAFAEAEAHKGVSLIVAYAPCVMQVRRPRGWSNCRSMHSNAWLQQRGWHVVGELTGAACALCGLVFVLTQLHTVWGVELSLLLCPSCRASLTA